MQWHAYLIAYPFGFLSRLTQISPAMTVAIAEAIAVVLALVVCARELSRSRCAQIYVWLILGVLIASPVLSIGSTGQLQPERLLILPIVVIFTQMERYLNSEKIQRVTIIAAYLFGAIISERSAMTLFWVTFAYLVMRSPKKLLHPRNNIFLLLGASSFCWWFAWTTKFQDSIYYNRVSINSMISGLRVSLTEDRSNTFKMLIVLVPLVVLSMFRWQGLVVGVISLIPNLSVSVGGAEKTGLATHYHAIYFAVFFGTATLGAIELSKRLHQSNYKSRARGHYLVAALSVLFIYNFAYSEAGRPSPKLIKKNLENTINAYGLNLYSRFDELNSSRLEMISYVQDIPVGSRISSPERTMPALIDQGDSLVSYFPLGVESSEVIFAETFESQISYLPWLMDNDTAREIGMCVLASIDERDTAYELKLLRSDLVRIQFSNVSGN
jgi:hypothetical protein